MPKGWIREKNILPPFWELNSFFTFKNLIKSLSGRDALCQVWLHEIGPKVLEKEILDFRQFIFAFSLLSPFGKGQGPSPEKKLNPHHPKMLCAHFGWNWPNGSGEKDFQMSLMYFCYFIIISPWKLAGDVNWTNLNSLYPSILCVKLGWNWPSGYEAIKNEKSFTKTTTDN